MQLIVRKGAGKVSLENEGALSCILTHFSFLYGTYAVSLANTVLRPKNSKQIFAFMIWNPTEQPCMLKQS